VENLVPAYIYAMVVGKKNESKLCAK